MATIWCACAETFNGEQEFRTHQWGLSRDKHHRSRAVAEQAPILPGGTLRTECHTTDMRHVTVVVAAEKVKRYGLGFWGVKRRGQVLHAGPVRLAVHGGVRDAVRSWSQ